MNAALRIASALGFALVAALCPAAEPITLDVSSAFLGISFYGTTAPIAIEAKNEGPSARGVIRVTSADWQMDYPIELPQGSTKRLFAYPPLYGGSATVELLSNRGRISRPYEATGGYGAQSVLMISDHPGEIAFLRVAGADAGQRQETFQDGYVAPGDAPPRAIGYESVNAVMLGSGAERMTDAEVAALQSYVLTGGCVVLVGGASAPLLNDARWTDLLPVENLRPITFTESSTLGGLGGSTPPAFSAVSGPLRNGSIGRVERGIAITAERGFGLGRVVFLAANPCESPLSTWAGRRNYVLRSVRITDSTRAAAFLRTYVPTAFPNNFAAGGRGPTPASLSTVGATPNGSPSDPFSTKLPPADDIAKILGAFFVVVIPLNFLILRKLKRGELAWFTAPIISVAFASVLFNSAQSLYSAKLSTASVGLIIGQQGVREGIFLGSTDMFMPRAGFYDLGLKDVDNLYRPSDGYTMGMTGRDSNLNPIDDGEIHAPAVYANNLSFRNMAFRQRMPVGEWLSVTAAPTTRSKWNATVRNSGPYPLREATLLVAGSDPIRISDVEPGATITVPFEVKNLKPRKAPQNWSLGPLLARHGRIAVRGMLDGVRPGPQLGSDVPARTFVSVLFMANEALK